MHRKAIFFKKCNFQVLRLWRINWKNLEKNEGRGYQRQLKCCYVFMLRWWISIASPNSGECKFPGALFPRLPSSWDAHADARKREKETPLLFSHFFPSRRVFAVSQIPVTSFLSFTVFNFLFLCAGVCRRELFVKNVIITAECRVMRYVHRLQIISSPGGNFSRSFPKSRAGNFL